MMHGIGLGVLLARERLRHALGERAPVDDADGQSVLDDRDGMQTRMGREQIHHVFV